jgi:hypothetical protein
LLSQAALAFMQAVREQERLYAAQEARVAALYGPAGVMQPS